jgi:hypothetical protein
MLVVEAVHLVVHRPFSVYRLVVAVLVVAVLMDVRAALEERQVRVGIMALRGLVLDPVLVRLLRLNRVAQEEIRRIPVRAVERLEQEVVR